MLLGPTWVLDLDASLCIYSFATKCPSPRYHPARGEVANQEAGQPHTFDALLEDIGGPIH